MNKIIFSFGILLLPIMASAQAYEGKTDYDKKKQDAFVIQFHYPAQAVENAIVKKLEMMGYKGKEEKGIFNKDRGSIVYKNVLISGITLSKLDYIIQVERKSRKEEDESVLYLIPMNNDQNAIAGFDPGEIRNAKSFLENLLPDVEAAQLELEIQDQEALVAKAEKKLKDLQQDKLDLEKKIQDNVKNQEDTQKDLGTQRQLLENLKLKRKAN
jgi:hypothetical protein